MVGTLRRNKNGIIRKLEIRRMAKVKKQRDVIKIKLRQKGYSKDTSTPGHINLMNLMVKILNRLTCVEKCMKKRRKNF
jgi:hypothetical protein